MTEATCTEMNARYPGWHVRPRHTEAFYIMRADAAPEEQIETRKLDSFEYLRSVGLGSEHNYDPCTDACDPQPSSWECECGATVLDNDDHDCHWQRGEAHHAAMMERDR